MRIIFTLLCVVIYHLPMAQNITGNVTNNNGQALPYAAITVQGTSNGVSANAYGNYVLKLPIGNYTLTCQHIGYATVQKKVTTTDNTTIIQNFILHPQQMKGNTVTVKTGGEDPAYAIIRQAIKKRDYYLKQVKGYSTNVYTKNIINLLNLPSKVMGKKIDTSDYKELNLDSAGKGIIYLAESVNKLHIQQPNKYKMQVISSRVSGSNSYGVSFPFLINLNNNNVQVFGERLNPRGFISPIADGALRYYKYKYLGSFTDNGIDVFSIRVTPRRLQEPLFSGTITITDDTWRIHSTQLLVTKSNGLELLDTLRLNQLYGAADSSAWLPKNQIVGFGLKLFGVGLSGSFVNSFSNYVINPNFDKKFFDKIIISYDTAVNKRTTSYWDSIRPMPLEKTEKRDYKVKDSANKVRIEKIYSKAERDSMNANWNKITPQKVLLTGINRYKATKKGRYNYGMQGLIANTSYNTVEGWKTEVNPFISFVKKNYALLAEGNVRYGIANKLLSPWLHLNIANRSLAQQHNLSLAGGKRISEYNANANTAENINFISTQYWGNNFMKIYSNLFAQVNYAKKIDDGLFYNIGVLWEDRQHLNNTVMDIRRKDKQNLLTNNYPIPLQTAAMPNHKATTLYGSISWQPGQRYIQFPKYKRSIGSKYPTTTLNYTLALPNLLGSTVNYSKWQLSVHDDKNLKLAGTFKYNISVGGFLHNNQTYTPDYIHFNGNTSLLAGRYMSTFQLAPFYQNSTTATLYATAHIEHHFNGLLTNKIPLFNKLKWNLVAGSNAFVVNKSNYYAEAFLGLENIFKIVRVDWVTAYSSNQNLQSNIRIGIGGILSGGAIQTETSQRRRSTRNYTK